MPKMCHNTIRMFEKKSNHLINPYYLKCIRYKCQKRENIRKYSFLKIAKNIPASIIYEIIIQFILEKKNGKEIEKFLEKKYDIVPNYKSILKIVSNIRYVIAEYLKYKYKLRQIGGDMKKILWLPSMNLK